jgi:K+-sensing histidine kinase KdpD
VQATPLGEVGDPADAILRAARHHHADVVVLGEDDRSWISRPFTGSVERALLRDSDVSVLVVADAAAPGSGDSTMRSATNGVRQKSASK